MADSGIEMTGKCKEIYDDITGPKSSLRYAVFKIENQETVVEKKGDRNKSYADFLTDLMQSEEPRYGLVMYTYQPDGHHKILSKTLLVKWFPDSDTASMVDKMLYMSSFDALRKEFDGVNARIETFDASDLEQGVVEKIWMN